MATKQDLMDGLGLLNNAVTRVEVIVTDLHTQQGVPEAELDEVAAGITAATDRLNAIV